MHQVHAPFMQNHPEKFLVMSNEGAELVKYGANGLLATKITFMNELAILAEMAGADINPIRRGIGMDTRIGEDFLYPGPGARGPCFEKDVDSLVAQGRAHGVDLSIMAAVAQRNRRQMYIGANKVIAHHGAYRGSLIGRRVGLWGVAFKKDVADTRTSSSIETAQRLLEWGAEEVPYFDWVPAAGENFMAELKYRNIPTERVRLCRSIAEAADCDDIVLLNDSRQFKTVHPSESIPAARKGIFADTRNILTTEQIDGLQQRGWVYTGNGRYGLPQPAAKRYLELAENT